MKILIIAAHPDDIEPQMGATIYQFTSSGHDVTMMTLILPEDDNKGNKIDGSKQRRRKEMEKSAKILSARPVIFDEDRETFSIDPRARTRIIEKIYKDYRPDIVFTCCEDDSHSDHAIVYRAVLGATRDNSSDLYLFQPVIPGNLYPQRFRANAFSHFSQHVMDKKLESIRCYVSQMEKSPRYNEENWIGATMARDKMYGGQLGTEYAEAFQMLRGKLHINGNYSQSGYFL